uniref:Major coat protein n=2 Tax=Grapevine leafroll-associated virus 2 TaxID=64003 RepID=A0A0F6R6H1_9CLOS|nr:major coat protein [Grapevine leafroll-associated virus 2]ULT60382.1 major capsid protein [Grapevine leafroll-associated virus 2]USN24353.1 major capsid protein [Grapevine leafroll-associated virus 2]UVX95186.1 major capsid protein [Grapevine leafroll-associated virus 2]WAA99853.1 major capsid protein [Grapevine leafroll-associated virus 2]
MELMSDENLNNLVITDATSLNGVDKKLLAAEVIKMLVQKGAPNDGIEAIFGLLLYALAARTTSPKVQRADSDLIFSNSFGERNVVVTEGDLKKVLDGCAPLTRFTNKLRTFGRTFTEAYIDFCIAYKHKLPQLNAAAELGIPAEDSYLAADFLGTCPKLSELQQSRKMFASMYALKTEGGVVNTPVSNLRQLGRREVM